MPSHQAGSAVLSSLFEEREVLQPELDRRGLGAASTSESITMVRTHQEPASTSAAVESGSRPIGGSASTSSASRFWKPGTIGPGINIEREDAGDAVDSSSGGGTGGIAVFNPYANMSLKQQRMLLPVYLARRHILYALEKFQVSPLPRHRAPTSLTCFDVGRLLSLLERQDLARPRRFRSICTRPAGRQGSVQ